MSFSLEPLKRAAWWIAYLVAFLFGIFAGATIQFQILEHPLLGGGIHCLLFGVLIYVSLYALTGNRPNWVGNTIIGVFSVMVTVLVTFIGWLIYTLLAMILVELLEKKLKKGGPTVLSS